MSCKRDEHPDGGRLRAQFWEEPASWRKKEGRWLGKQGTALQSCSARKEKKRLGDWSVKVGSLSAVKERASATLASKLLASCQSN